MSGQILATGAWARATTDGELVMRELQDGGRYKPISHRPALLEAKNHLRGSDGKAQLTDDVLSQMTCEAVAYRLTSKDSDSVFVIAAARRYMRFLQFTVPESYVTSLETSEQMKYLIELRATPWFDLRSPSGRKNAIGNIVALVRRQTQATSPPSQ
ncbi:uncharacterized protein B0T15DRAFT_285460 [Chaetomium strumarium]|uniref:Uncharacterized protein n=1 Tax=Chaetomium strumarium TaxID=1170767 RepID=A0AAJ0GPM5_9PEZI|nr:hypothetical protein B0T15DRAFT_285460 [Chaetomium strumarium]